MRGKLAFAIGLLLLFHMKFNAVESKATDAYPVHNLDTGLSYATIQEAIDSPETLDGNKIFVGEGIYHEHVVLNKSLSLVGENRSKTIIDGNRTGTVVNITASNVNIMGFTIQNSGPALPALPYNAGIYVGEWNEYNNVSCNIVENNNVGVILSSSSDNTISGNTMTNNDYCIRLEYSKNNAISENTMANNRKGIIVELWDSSYNSISGNTITENEWWGVLIREGSSNNNMTGNTITNTGEALSLWDSSSYNIISANNITNNADGIYLYSNSNHNSISSNNIIANDIGITLSFSSNNYVSGNKIKNNATGVKFDYSSSNVVSGSDIADNSKGIELQHSFDNSMTGNNISNNQCGISIYYSAGNRIFQNNLINNTSHIQNTEKTWVNVWDNGLEGNYWSDFTGLDSNDDGTSGSPYNIDSNNTDHHALMGIFSDHSAGPERHVQTICNSSISDFQFNGTALILNVSGENGTDGFCRICIPTALMNLTYKVFVNGSEVRHTLLPCSNSTHSYLHFHYTHSMKEIVIVPEFHSFLFVSLFMASTLLAITFHKRRPPSK